MLSLIDCMYSLPHILISFVKQGSAEVVFARRSDAFQALKRYNNVQLDGKPMKIEIVGANAEIPLSARVNVVGGVNGKKRTVVMAYVTKSFPKNFIFYISYVVFSFLPQPHYMINYWSLVFVWLLNCQSPIFFEFSNWIRDVFLGLDLVVQEAGLQVQIVVLGKLPVECFVGHHNSLFLYMPLMIIR